MPLFFKFRVPLVTALSLSMLSCVTVAHAVMDPRFELDLQTLAGKKSPSKPHQAGGKRSSRNHVVHSSSTHAKGECYTVKSGDHLFKILMRDYGLSNNEAESFIEEIKRENNISILNVSKLDKK